MRTCHSLFCRQSYSLKGSSSRFPCPAIGMASGSQNKTPMTSHSHHRLPWRGREFMICLKSEYSSFSEDGIPPVLVEVVLDFFVKFAVPAPVEGGFYDFASYMTPPKRYRFPIDNPSQHLSMIDAFRESTAPLVANPLHRKILRILGPDILCLADAKSAEVEGDKAMKVGAIVNCFLRLDLNMVEELINYYRANPHPMGGGEEESLGTCSVCLDEIKKEWICPVTLSCSHIFHLGCVAPWLQRHNSCPMCRSSQPIVRVSNESLA